MAELDDGPVSGLDECESRVEIAELREASRACTRVCLVNDGDGEVFREVLAPA